MGIVPPHVYRPSFLLLALVLTFLYFPARRPAPARVTAIDLAWIAGSLVSLAWPLVDAGRFPYRAATPGALDIALGAVCLACVLEATRRSVGWILPTTTLAFLLYAYLGPLLELVGLGLVAHRGYGLERLIGSLYMTLDGIFGIPLDVAATYVVMFAIYGAVLERSGAGRFFIDWALAALKGARAGPARAVAGAGFLLGTVSGSGVATTITLGSVAWPLLRRAGYGPEAGGALLAASGIGALLSPPTLGAAAFLIAEFLHVPYLRVLVMATVPTLLYYLAIGLMIEADARRLGRHSVAIVTPSLRELTARGGFHFASLLLIPGLMLAGLTPFRAVLWALLTEIALSLPRSQTRLTPRKLLAALEAAGRSVLPVAATTATAGIIVGVVTLTGLGLKLAGVLVALAGDQLFLGVLYSAVAVLVLGLAVPVTASYVIAAVMIAPALVRLGVPELAAHMFIFYYAVLSEVSPPTALSPFAAAALTGGNAFRTMLLALRYTLPAFLVPLAFTLSPQGMGLLLQAPLPDIAWSVLTAGLGVGGLAVGLGGWLHGELGPGSRAAALLGGLLLVGAFAWADLAGAVLLAAVLALAVARSRNRRPPSRP